MAVKKKSSKKSVVKSKLSSKKSVSPKTEVEVTITKKVLGNAPQQYHFVLRDGRAIKNVYELVDELETMVEDDFIQHVNETKNDFSNWVRDVFDDHFLADHLSSIKNRIDTQRALLKHLVRELRRASKS